MIAVRPGARRPLLRLSDHSTGFQLLLAAGVAAYVVALAWSMQHTSFDVWGGLVVGPVLVAVTVPIANHLARRDGDLALAGILVAGLVLKMVAAVVRYVTAYTVYEGLADASTYHEAGRWLAPMFRQGIFSVDVGEVVGTGFMSLLTGVVYVFTGPTQVGGFLAFAWISLWGLYLFYRAFRLAVPDGDGRRYAKLLFFLPSLLYWPSSIGKEAWMTLTLGLTAYAAARLLARRRGGFALLVLGLGGSAMVRPHVALVAFGAVAVGLLARRIRNPTPFALMARAAGVVAMVVISMVLLTQVQEFLGLDRLDPASVDQALSRAQTNTSAGGSEFEAPRATSVVQLPVAIVSVLFRPFPFEARNAQTIIASAEGTVLLVLFARSRKRVLAALLSVRRQPFGALALTYVVLFAFVFSSFGNFGIIARQRVQMLPFALVFLALPTLASRAPAVAPTGVTARPRPAPARLGAGAAR